MFSINCLEILEKCDESLRKNLTLGKFFFNDKYTEKKGCIKYNKLSLMNQMPDFWGPKINIQALVGMNGSGKSTLLDLMYMVINNFSYMFERGNERPGAEPLLYVKDLYVDLYFSIDISNKECEACLMSRGNVIQLKIKGMQKKYEKVFIIDEHDGPLNRKNEYEKGLTDIEIADLVQKSFYTIVSNYSMQSFISSNYVQKVFLHNRHFVDNEEYQEDIIDSEKRCWINPIFHKNDGYVRSIVLNPYRYDGILDLDNELKLSKERIANLFVWDQLQIKHKPIFEPYSFFAIEVRKKDFYGVVYEVSNDFSRRFRSLGKGHPLPIVNPETFHSDFVTRMIDSMFMLQQDSEIYEKILLLTKKEGIGISSDAFMPKKIEEDFLAKKIVEFFRIESYKSKKYYEESLRYMRHKIIKIVYTYDSYKDFRITVIEALFKAEKKLIEKKIFLLLQKIKDDSSHVVKKIRRVVNFIILDEIYSLYANFNLEYFIDKISKLSHSPFSYNLEKISPDIIDDCFPPPFFDYWLKLRKKCSDTVIDYSMLSSGEIQLLQTLSIHAYHIANLMSVQNNRPKYSCINLVFDELEVCMHPEMQRQFVFRLVEMLKNIKKESVCFNVVIITHSPFILSDIPKSYVLYLKDGSSYKKIKSKNFGANINDLFRESFFLGGGFIGEYAKEKISSLVKYLQSKRKYIPPWNEKLSKEFIESVVGDDIIEDCLRKMYCHKFGKENE